MAEEQTAASLSKKTVVQLKELLATHSLPVTGKKDDLIQRLLSHLSTLSAPPTVDSTGAASAVDEPDGQGHSGTAEVSQAANVETERGAEEVVDGTRTAPGSTEAAGELDGGAGAQQGEEEEALKKKEAREAEEEKRRKRLERFGGGGAAAGPSEEELAKLKRAEKSGINVAAAEKEGEKEGGKLDKSLALLDAPLGSSRRQGREPAPRPAPTSKAIPVNEGGVVNAAAAKKGGVSAAEAAAEPAAAVAADPELKRKLEEEEEKKRKRAERFGAPQAEKKAKLDDSAAADAATTTA